MAELLCPEHQTAEAYQFTVRPDWHDPFSYLTRFEVTFGCGLNLGMVLSDLERTELPVYPVTPSEWAALILSRWDRAFRPAEAPPCTT